MTPDDQQRLARIQSILAGNGTAKEARETSGLSMGQASRVAGVCVRRLIDMECGYEEWVPVTPDEYARLLAVYDVPRFSGANVVAGPAREVRQCLDCHAAWSEGETERHTTQCALMREARGR